MSIGWWRKLNNEKLNNLYSSRNTRALETKEGQIGGMCDMHCWTIRYTRFLFEEVIEVAVSEFALLLSESDILSLFGSFVALCF